jgi:drug/metabolite transporter (DMT)-like permease
MRPGRNDYLLLILLGAVWGSSFLFIKLAVATLPPISIAAGRIGIGAIALTILMAASGMRWPTARTDWLKLIAMGLFGNILPFSLINWGETHIDSGITAILMSVVPLATILMAHFFAKGEPLSLPNIAAVALGMTGVIILVGPSAMDGLGNELLGELAVISAAVCYAANGIIVRRLTHLPAAVIGACALISATVLGVPASLTIDQPWQMSPSMLSLIALLVLGVVNTAGGYLLLFRLIERTGAGFASFNNFLVPLFGVLWGAALLGEIPAPEAYLALAIILAGMAMPRLWPARAVKP